VRSRFKTKLFLASFAVALLSGSLWYLATQYEWRASVASLQKIDFARLAVLIFFAQVAFLAVRTWRWLIVVRVSNPDIRFRDLYWISAVLLSLSIITPGQLGEALKIELLKRQGLLDRLPGLGSFALERLLDLVVIAGMGVVGLALDDRFSHRFPWFHNAAIVLCAAGVLVFWLLWVAGPHRLPTGYLRRLRHASGTPAVWGKMALLTVAGWGLVAVAWQVTLGAADIQLTVPETLWLISLVTVGTILSFIPGGVGVADLLTVEALIGVGIEQVAAQSGALLLRAYAFIVVLIGIGHAVCWSLLSGFCSKRQNDS